MYVLISIYLAVGGALRIHIDCGQIVAVGLIQIGLDGDSVEELLPGATPHGIQGGCVTRSAATGWREKQIIIKIAWFSYSDRDRNVFVY